VGRGAGGIRAELIRGILVNVEESADPWVKAAFYSDSDVLRILSNIYERWERGGMSGEPLNYATDNELEVLFQKSRAVRPLVNSSDHVRRMMLRAIYGEVPKEEVEDRRAPSFLRVLRRLFLPGSE